MGGIVAVEGMAALTARHPVVVFIRPGSAACQSVLNLLDSIGVEPFVQSLQGQPDLAMEVEGLKHDVPQLFVAGTRFGGAEVVQKAVADGSLQAQLSAITPADASSGL